MTRILIALTMLVMAPGWAVAQTVDYDRDVKPILKARCYSCHGALKQESGLRLDTGAAIRKGGDGGRIVMPGKVKSSELLKRVASSDKSERMPPEGKPLTPAEIQQIRDWIGQGARSPRDEQAEEDPRRHWAFQRPLRAALPAVRRSSWIGNPIDAFVARRHEQHGLLPLPPAERQVLLRRVYLDLIGLPPTRHELAAFLKDDSANAYEKVVNGLLNSPQFGERWGRHWMDVWRYSDWYGRRRVPDCLNSYGQIWRWRDWIVRSLNEDKGYDRMIVEMLAADEIAPQDSANIVATGFIVRNFYRWNYNTWMKDAVEHTGKAFLGLTLNCCHCHDHKYDPITNEEYFRFRAFFEPIEIRHDRVAGEADPGPYPKYSYGKAYKPINSGLVRIMDEKLDAKTFVYTGGESRNVIAGKPPVRPGGPAVLGGDKLTIEAVKLPATSWYPGLQDSVRQAQVGKARRQLSLMRTTLAKAKQLAAAAKSDADREAARLTLSVDQLNLSRAEAEVAAVEARVEADKVRYQAKTGNAGKAARMASLAERQARLQTVRVELARAERSLAAARRKPAADKKAAAGVKKAESKVAAARAAVTKSEKSLKTESSDYTPFGPQYPRQSTGRRTALARWIANTRNPLTARVAVNHIWLRHFGRAFVESTDNLGRSGSKPTHPQLLDWLAVELMDHGWRMKHIHRLIVTSNTYRMSSRAAGPATAQQNAARQRDPDNISLWRFNTNRMQAEVLRDSILYVAGSLDCSLGGKEIDQKLGLNTPRRSIYFEHHGEGRMVFLDLFDAADPCDAYRRLTSVRPQQALAMTNSDLTVRQGRLLARRIGEQLAADLSTDPTAQGRFVRVAFEQILSRSPSPAELQASSEFLQRQTQLFRKAKPAELAAGVKNEPVPASTDPVVRARESLVQALFSHHDFVTIR